MNYQIVSILDSILGPHRSFAKGEHYYSCPFCGHHNPKLAVNVVNGRWQCWKCQTRGGSLMGLLRKMHAPREYVVELAKLVENAVQSYVEEPDTRPLTLPAGFKPLWGKVEGFTGNRALAYARSRHLTDDDLFRFNIGYCAEGMYRNRLIIPSYDADGPLNYFCSRDFTGESQYKYMNPPTSRDVVGFDSHLNWDYPIVIVEGYLDAMTVKRNATPLAGKTLSKKLQKKIIEMGAKDIYLALDADALKDTIKIAQHYMEQDINVWLVGLDGKDPNVIGTSGMNQLIKGAKKLTFGDLMKLKLRLC